MSQPSRRRLLGLVGVGWLTACVDLTGAAADPQRSFKGIGIVLVVDAVPGAELERVKFYDDRSSEFFSHSLVSKKNRGIMALGGVHVPMTARVVWREGAGWDDVQKVWNEGTIAGDHTIPVAERIPDAVLNDIRARGGALRLKFRLKPDGVMFGWDIERDGGGISKFDMPGGDFLDTRY